MSGLAFTTQYTVEIKARNGDSEETSYSSQTNVTTTADSNAPTPNPPTFSSTPSNDSDVQISMVANAVTDPSTPVQYYFAAVTGSCGANIGECKPNHSFTKMESDRCRRPDPAQRRTISY